MYSVSKSINRLTLTSNKLNTCIRGISTLSNYGLKSSNESKSYIIGNQTNEKSNYKSTNSNIYRHFSSKTGSNIQSTSFNRTPMGVFADQLFLQPINPANTKPITDLRIDTKVTLQQKFERAYLFKDQWKNVSKEEKKLIISKFRDMMVERIETLASDLTNETGKPIVQAKNEIRGCIDRINFFLHNFEEVTGNKLVRETEQFQEILTYEPVGVIANISAWNYPFFVGLNVIIPALLTGNCVLYKPSELSSITGLNIMSMLYECGLPEPAFQIVLGKSLISQSILALPIDGVYFTGSHKTGKAILETLAGRVVKTQLELGGKCAAYVHKSCDIGTAAASLADGAMYNTGQSCCSVERIYVDKEIYDKFVDELVMAVRSLRFSFDPTNPKSYFGPLTRGIPQIEHLQRLIGGALKRGAILELGGNVVDEAPGYFFAPTVLSNVHHGMEIQREEIFGPVVTVQPVSGRDEASALMNDTPFGLAGSVYANDLETVNFIIDKANSGTVYWNSCDRISPYLPWTGRNHSGIGSTLGTDGILSFVRPKALHLVSSNKNPQFSATKLLSNIVPSSMLSAVEIMQQKGMELNDYKKSPRNEMEAGSPALPSGINVHPVEHTFPIELPSDTEDRELLTDNDESTNTFNDSNEYDIDEFDEMEEEDYLFKQEGIVARPRSIFALPLEQKDQENIDLEKTSEQDEETFGDVDLKEEDDSELEEYKKHGLQSDNDYIRDVMQKYDIIAAKKIGRKPRAPVAEDNEDEENLSHSEEETESGELTETETVTGTESNELDSNDDEDYLDDVDGFGQDRSNLTMTDDFRTESLSTESDELTQDEYEDKTFDEEDDLSIDGSNLTSDKKEK